MIIVNSSIAQQFLICVFRSMIQPPPIFVGRPYSNGNNVSFNRAYNELARVQSPLFWQVSGSQQFGQMWEEQFKVRTFAGCFHARLTFSFIRN